MVMFMILAGIVIAVVIGVLLLRCSDENYGFFSGFVGMVLLAGAGTISLGFCFIVWSWYASDYKAQIINRAYGTNYTREEVFFASNVINTVRELDRKRIEVNGNVFTRKEK